MRLRIAAVSDLHLGAQNSYLNIAKVRQRLVSNIRERSGGHLGGLFLVGDILDLTVGHFPGPWLAAKEFLDSLLGDGLEVDDIFYLPGNHDHHIWVQLVEYKEILQKLDSMTRNSVTKGETADLFSQTAYGYPTPLHGLFPERVRKKVRFVYPFYSHVEPHTRTRFVFHHGHYFDPAITPLAEFAVKRYKETRKIEAMNLAYIESLFYFCAWDPAVQQIELSGYDLLQRTALFAKHIGRLARGQADLDKFRQWLSGKETGGKASLGQCPVERIEAMLACRELASQENWERDIWGFGHTHFADYWPKEETGTARMLFNLGGWVLNCAPQGGEDAAWSIPAVLHWDEDTGPLLESIELSDKEKDLLVSRVYSMKR